MLQDVCTKFDLAIIKASFICTIFVVANTVAGSFWTHNFLAKCNICKFLPSFFVKHGDPLKLFAIFNQLTVILWTWAKHQNNLLKIKHDENYLQQNIVLRGTDWTVEF